MFQVLIEVSVGIQTFCDATLSGTVVPAISKEREQPLAQRNGVTSPKT